MATATATHMVKISVYIVKPPYVNETELRGWILGLLEGKIPRFDVENIEIEKA